MSEAKKLSEQQLELIRVRYSGDGSPLGMLIDHIDAIIAEHEAAMTRAREDADRVGKARIRFEDLQALKLVDRDLEIEKLKSPAFQAIRDEIERQNAKWGDQSGHPLPVWYTILGEEVGEVAQAILQMKPEECLTELIQVAAVAVQMYSAIQKANGPG